MRADWHACQSDVNPEKLVFLDETCLKTDMTRLRGWAEGGDRLVESLPGGHWKTNTLIQGVGLHGTRAALILDGPMNSLCFTGFCERFLAPALSPGGLVVLDNLSSHKSSAAVAAIEAVGAQMVYLPPYSPDLNPIETFSRRSSNSSVASTPRTWPDIIDAAREALLAITTADLHNTFEHCGYTEFGKPL